MFACLTLVEVLRQNGLTTSDARGEVASAFFTVDVTIPVIYNEGWTYNSVILALQSLFGQLNSFFCLSMGGCLLNRLIAKSSYCSLSFSVTSDNRSSLTKAFEHSL